MPYRAYLLLGSNIEPRTGYLEEAIALLSQKVTVAKRSSVYETAAWGMEEGTPAFLNMALEVNTHMAPARLLEYCIECEKELGRLRTGEVTSRTIDIDILLYGSTINKAEHLTLPHPRLHLRRFALAPLAEIAREIIHPVLNKSIKELLEECMDDSEVKKLSHASPG